MPIKVVCSHCHKNLNAPDSAAGRTASCPQCKTRIPIPRTAAAPPSQPPQAKAAVPVATVVGASPPASPAVAKQVKPIVVKAAPPRPARSVVPPPIKTQPAVDPLTGLEPLPSFDPLESSDPLGGLSLDVLCADALGAGTALGGAPSPLAAAPRPRHKIDLVPVFIIAGVVLVAGLVMGGIYLLTRGGGRADWMRYMPDDAQVIARVDMNSIRKSGLYEKALQANPAMNAQFQQALQAAPIKLDDVASAAFGGAYQGQDTFVAVVYTNRTVSDSDMEGFKPQRKETIGERTLFIAGKIAGTRLDDKTILVGGPKMIKAVLSREGPPRLSAALNAAVAEADFSSSIAAAFVAKGLPKGAMPGPAAGFDASQLESVAVSADLGSSIDVDAAVLFVSDNVASDLKDKIDQQMNMLRQMSANLPPQAQSAKDVLDSLRIGRSGRKLTASVRIPQSAIDQMANMGRPRPGASPFTAPPNQSQPSGIPSRRRPSGRDPNLPPTAPSRGLF